MSAKSRKKQRTAMLLGPAVRRYTLAKLPVTGLGTPRRVSSGFMTCSSGSSRLRAGFWTATLYSCGDGQVMADASWSRCQDRPPADTGGNIHARREADVVHASVPAEPPSLGPPTGGDVQANDGAVVIAQCAGLTTVFHQAGEVGRGRLASSAGRLENWSTF